ncbi:MAG: hypothetical protein IOC82_14610 [Aestuariivirga sp.]|uniref:cysteine rich repeat-containing protein n=1 Tax=Aestuariivirga sp. TaxID=2650926 RepID=UPI0025B81EC2|nr:hypothetical protein [Aestuariivirga sp.]MCA3562253.1 hypothetical protein [Aestuariivirga sp.]
MRKLALAALTLGGLATSAIAETALERLDHGVHVVKECAGDIRQFCKDVKPGAGRIKACVAGHLAELSAPCISAIANPPPAVQTDGANTVSKRIDMRQMRYIEMFLASLDPKTGNILAECYGTYADPEIPANMDSAPQAKVEALNMKEIAKEYGVLAASLNGPKLSIADWWEIDVGQARQFGELTIPWTAQLNLGKQVDVNKVTPYEPQTIARKSAVNWNKGSKVMVLDDPEGNVWIMKGYQLGLTPRQSYADFMAEGPSVFKKLPPGWKARIATLAQDNLEIPQNGVATILSDEFFNVYDKTGPGMSNSKP